MISERTGCSPKSRAETRTTSTGCSAPMTDAFASLPSGRVLQYHNVTPASYFAPYDPALFRLAALGRTELATLVGRVDLKAERTRDALHVVGAFAEPGQQTSRVAEALAAELQTMASWLGLSAVTVGDRGDLATKLSRSLG